MDENEHEVEAFRQFWEGKGAQVKVRPKLEWGRSAPFDPTSLITKHLPNRLPLGNNTMAIHQNGDVVACAVDYEGKHIVGKPE